MLGYVLFARHVQRRSREGAWIEIDNTLAYTNVQRKSLQQGSVD